MSLLAFFLTLFLASFRVSPESLPKRPLPISPSQWNTLNRTVNGRLHAAEPFARPCFRLSATGGIFDETACNSIMFNYLNSSVRSDSFAAHMPSQWEGCQSANAQCALNWQNVSDPTAFAPPKTCHQGSVSSYYIDVENAQDAQAAFAFSRSTGVPLVIKNTGHDYNGRSSAPNSLGLWYINLVMQMIYNPQFLPQGCLTRAGVSAVTVGAGIQTIELFEFAAVHNITLPGGACPTVGVVGGYLQGGGHSWLSNIYGLAVDRALEFEVVTPTGNHVFANACQNTDLFFALRGGGGGTFGFVLSATTKALPQTSPTSVVVTYTANDTTLPIFVNSIVSNAVQWAADGWSGFILPTSSLVLTSIDATELQAREYMRPLADLAKEIEGTFSVTTTPSYLSFYNTFVAPATAGETVASRLISVDTFKKNSSVLAKSLVELISVAPASFIFANAPYSFKQDISLGPASVTPAWRNSLWHVVANQWFFNTPPDLQTEIYQNLSAIIDPLRAISPASGAYQNEADLFEPNFPESFWGDNYDRLLQIKNKYDPEHVLDCWHCVGWSAMDDLFSCYL
ncbi:FAD-binding domain-containing protein [Mycena galopus ATCC 62051]|nr:FAD-binding domain-containing protein [Mycena galopus ATCC 62051]